MRFAEISTPSRVSGFGVVTGEVCTRLAGLGHDVRILGWWADVGETHSGIEVCPCPVDPAAAVLAIARDVRKFKPHYLITLGDIPWVSYLGADDFLRFLHAVGTKWCLYYPVDGTLPDGSLPVVWARVLSRADIPVTMSSFGKVASARSGITAAVIPHGCNTELFRPAPNKREAKRRFGYEQKFVILSDVRNHRRKLIPRALDIIRRLRVSDDTLVFHLHTNTEPKEDLESYSYDLAADIKIMRAGLRKSIFTGDWPEPFGLAMTEAMACGTPVIAYRNGSVPEVIEDGHTGFIVKGLEDAVEAVRRIPELSRNRCREVFEQRFTVTRMARDYVRVYERLIKRSQEKASKAHV
jgi:glycosyltransferase involved in cell wall biosynthesis